MFMFVFILETGFTLASVVRFDRQLCRRFSIWVFDNKKKEIFEAEEEQSFDLRFGEVV